MYLPRGFTYPSAKYSQHVYAREAKSAQALEVTAILCMDVSLLPTFVFLCIGV
jgi:hypothetical protein